MLGAVVPVLEREGSRRDTAMLNQCLVGQVSYLLLFRFLFYHQVGSNFIPLCVYVVEMRRYYASFVLTLLFPARAHGETESRRSCRVGLL